MQLQFWATWLDLARSHMQGLVIVDKKYSRTWSGASGHDKSSDRQIRIVSYDICPLHMSSKKHLRRSRGKSHVEFQQRVCMRAKLVRQLLQEVTSPTSSKWPTAYSKSIHYYFHYMSPSQYHSEESSTPSRHRIVTRNRRVQKVLPHLRNQGILESSHATSTERTENRNSCRALTLAMSGACRRGVSLEVDASGDGAAVVLALRGPQLADGIGLASTGASGRAVISPSSCIPRLVDGIVVLEKGGQVMPESWREFGGGVSDGRADQASVCLLDAVQLLPCWAGLVGWGGDVGVIDSVVEDRESYGVHGVNAEGRVARGGCQRRCNVGDHDGGVGSGSSGRAVCDFELILMGVTEEEGGNRGIEALDDLICDSFFSLWVQRLEFIGLPKYSE